MRKIKKNDEVVVLVGKNKGLHGKVLSVLDNGAKVIVEGINMIKKHVKSNPKANIKGGIIEKEAAIDFSNIAIYNKITEKRDKVIFKLTENGKKVRCFRSTGKLIDV